MSYQSQAQLENDPEFQQRTRSVTVQQAGTFRNDARPSWVAVANGILKDEGGLWACFNRLDASGPDISDKVEIADGIDQSLVTDGDLLALTQANWPTVAGLYFNEDGTPIGG
jgi:hypothetical protein